MTPIQAINPVAPLCFTPLWDRKPVKTCRRRGDRKAMTKRGSKLVMARAAMGFKTGLTGFDGRFWQVFEPSRSSINVLLSEGMARAWSKAP